MSASPVSAMSKPRPYRRFLTSALHARFVQAAVLTLILGYTDGLMVGEKSDLFWSWFPLGPAGIRGLLFFMTSLFLFILHIATLNVGRRTTKSSFATLRSSLFNLSTFQTWLWYTVSAFWFTEAYIWSCSGRGGLEWVTRGDMRTPDRLNERPIYVRAHFLVLAACAAVLHLYYDKSSMHIPVALPPSPQDTDQQTHRIEPLQAHLQRQWLRILLRSGLTAVLAIFPTMLLYFTMLRQPLWHLHLVFAKPWFNLPRADAEPSGFSYSHPTALAISLIQTMLVGFLLMLTWELSSILFMTYLKQEPLKNGFPLSATSKDPNGTLLNGIRAKRDVVRTFAFWELTLIAQKYPDRRKAIFADIDRVTGPVWSQILQEGLSIIQAVETRVKGPSPSTQSTSTVSQQPQIATLPRMIPEVGNQPILVGQQPQRWSSDWVQKFAANEMSQLGRSSEPWTPPVAEAKKALQDYAQQQGVAGKELVDQWYTSAQEYSWFTRLSMFFKMSRPAKADATVLGYPCGNAAIIVDACESITKMLIASLAEDTYGKAISGVAQTVKTYTSVITTIEQFAEQTGLRLEGDVEEVAIVLSRLKVNLNELLSAFQLFLSDRGLSIIELNAAKKAAEQKPMKEEKGRVEGQQQQRQIAQDPAAQRDGQSDQPQPRRLQRHSSNDRQQRPSKDTGKGANGHMGRGQNREMEMVR